MNILVLTDEIFPDAIGGVGKSLRNELKALSHRGHKITVYTRGIRAELPEYELSEGIDIVRVRGLPRNSRLYYLYPIHLFPKLIFLLRRQTLMADVLVIHNPFFLLAAHVSGITKRIPTVYVFHASVAEEIRLNAKQRKYGSATPIARFAATFIEGLERWGLRRVRQIISHSDFMSRILHRWFTKSEVPIETIPIGLDITHYQPKELNSSRLMLDLSEEHTIFITVRRLVARTGINVLIRAFCLIHDQKPDAILLIIGSGYLKADLEALISEKKLQHHVRLLGFISEKDLPFYLASANLFVLPTQYLEGFGLATVEALASGIPVVGTPVGATPELLMPIDSKLVTRDSSAESLAETMLYWLNHPDELNALKQRSRTHVERFYDADRIAEQLETLFQSLL